MFDAVIEEFGNAIGLENVRPDDGGVVCMEFARTGELFLEPIDGALLVSLVRPYDKFREGLLESLLEQCDPKYHRDFHVNAGLSRDDRLVLTIRLPENKVERSAIERALDYMAAMFDRLLG